MVPRRVFPSSIVKVIAAALLLFAGVGCSKPLHVIDVTDDLAKWKGPATAAPAARRPGSITVSLVGTPTMGVLGYPGQVTNLVPIAAAQGEEKKAFEAMLERDNKAGSGVLVKGIGEAARAILQENLSRYFERARVDLVPAAAPSGMSVTASRLILMPGFFTRTALFSWKTTLPTGQAASAEAVPERSSAAGHLGWALPLSVLTFPLGLAICSPIFDSIYKGMEENKTIEAIDLASASLAAQLAGYAPTPNAAVAAGR
jgi:hypothetical protein